MRTQEGFLAEDDLGASDVYEREDAEAQEVLPPSAAFCSSSGPAPCPGIHACVVHCGVVWRMCTNWQHMVLLPLQAIRHTHPFAWSPRVHFYIWMAYALTQLRAVVCQRRSLSGSAREQRRLMPLRAQPRGCQPQILPRGRRPRRRRTRAQVLGHQAQVS